MESRLSKVIPFHDDLASAAKIFVSLNAYRKLSGSRKVEWSEILCELAVSRSHQLVRSKSGIVKLMQIGGSKFNLGVSYVDITAYSPIEEKDGKQVPAHRMMENAWKSIPKFSEALIDPLARFAAVSVYTSDKTACITIFISILPPNSFPPMSLKEREEGKLVCKKRKSKKGKKRTEKDTDIITDGETDTDSQDECPAMPEIEELHTLNPDIDELPSAAAGIDATPIEIISFEDEIRTAAEKTWSDGRVCISVPVKHL